MPEFGDILKYDPEREGEQAWRFMFINSEMGKIGYVRALVVTIDAEDDLWVPGESVIVAGVHELVLADD